MKLLLVDGTNLAMRWAFAMLRDGQAEATDTQALAVAEACAGAIRDCARTAGAGHAVVALDDTSCTPTWRKELFPAYKANRDGNGGTGLWSRRLRDHLDESGWAWASSPSFEGDDVIATLAARAQADGRPRFLRPAAGGLVAVGGVRLDRDRLVLG